MRRSSIMARASVCGLMVLATSALAMAAETTIEIKNVHLCCVACVKGVAAAIKDVDGVKARCDQKAGTVTVTAADEATARKGLDALADAGYFGETGSKSLALKPASDVPSGTVKKLSLSNTHNCCRSCANAIKKAVTRVAGVTGETVQPKTADFDVSGDFDAAAVVKSLNDAGFQVQVK